MGQLYKKWTGLAKPPARAKLDRNHPLVRGLVFFAALNENGGHTPMDLAGPLRGGLTATTTNPPKWTVEAPFGRVYDGSTTSITCVYQWPAEWPPHVQISQITIEAFVKKKDTGAQVYVSKGRNNIAMWGAGKLATTDNYHMYRHGATDSTIDSGIAAGSDWEHVVWTIDTDNLPRLYVNGVLRFTSGTAYALEQAAEPLKIGALQTTSGGAIAQFWEGNIAYVRVWKRALQNSEINKLYKNPWDMLMGERRLTHVDAGGPGTEALEGSFESSAATTLALSVTDPLAGTHAAASNTTLALSVTDTLSGTHAAASNTTLAISVTDTLSGTHAAASAVTLDLTTIGTEALAGTHAAAATVTLDLTTSAGEALAGTHAAAATVTLDLTNGLSLAGTHAASATVTNSLSITDNLSGTIAASSAVSCGLSGTQRIAGQASAAATTTAALTVTKPAPLPFVHPLMAFPVRDSRTTATSAKEPNGATFAFPVRNPSTRADPVKGL